MSTEIVTALVLEKQQLATDNQHLLAILGTVIAGKNGTAEVRVTKTQLNKTADKVVAVRGLKGGGVVITVKDAE